MFTICPLFKTNKSVIADDAHGDIAHLIDDAINEYIAKGNARNSIYIKYESQNGFYSMIVWSEKHTTYREYFRDLSFTDASYATIQEWLDSDRHVHLIRAKIDDDDVDCYGNGKCNGGLSDLFGDDDNYE
jgi:hypothetical protein